MESEFSIGPLIGSGGYHEIYFSGVHIGYDDLRLRNQTVVEFEADIRSVELHFHLSGDCLTHLDTYENPVQFLYVKTLHLNTTKIYSDT